MVEDRDARDDMDTAYMEVHHGRASSRSHGYEQLDLGTRTSQSETGTLTRRADVQAYDHISKPAASITPEKKAKSARHDYEEVELPVVKEKELENVPLTKMEPRFYSLVASNIAQDLGSVATKGLILSGLLTKLKDQVCRTVLVSSRADCSRALLLLWRREEC